MYLRRRVVQCVVIRMNFICGILYVINNLSQNEWMCLQEVLIWCARYLIWFSVHSLYLCYSKISPTKNVNVKTYFYVELYGMENWASSILESVFHFMHQCYFSCEMKIVYHVIILKSCYCYFFYCIKIICRTKLWIYMIISLYIIACRCIACNLQFLECIFYNTLGQQVKNWSLVFPVFSSKWNVYSAAVHSIPKI